MNGLVKFSDHFARTQTPTIGKRDCYQISQYVQQCHIMGNRVFDAGADNLYRHLAPGEFAPADGRKMHLCDRGARDRRQVEIAEHFVICATHLCAVHAIQYCDDLLSSKGRYAILQGGQFLRDVGRNQIGARRKQLAKFDKNRPQTLQRQTQTQATRLAETAPEERAANERAREPDRQEFIQTESDDNRKNFD